MPVKSKTVWPVAINQLRPVTCNVVMVLDPLVSQKFFRLAVRMASWGLLRAALQGKRLYMDTQDLVENHLACRCQTDKDGIGVLYDQSPNSCCAV